MSEFKWEKNVQQLIEERGLNKGGKTQKYIDTQVIKYDKKYCYFESGHLADAHGTVPGSGKVVHNDPYARYLYYGFVMVDPVTGSPWARKNVKKIKTARKLRYKGIRGPLWFERMKADEGDKILKGACHVAGAEVRRRHE